MIKTVCPNCGAEVPLFARACRHCGAPNTVRRNAVVVVAALSALGLAVVVVVLVVVLSGRPSDRTATDLGAATGDFAWLEKAMKDCDGEAGKSPDALYFLVTPLVDEPRDEAGWRRISVNDIGNAILISSGDMMAGLRRKALRLSTDEYVFATRIEATKEGFSWKPSVGVRKFIKDDAAGVEAFRVRFESSDAARGFNWGSVFKRQPGNCYWVNAILRN
jgi:hypothetical protein